MSNIRKRCCCYTRGFEKNIDYKGMEEIINKYPTIVKNKNEYIVLYCTSGIRSKKAQNILISMGYTNVYNLISEFY